MGDWKKVAWESREVLQAIIHASPLAISVVDSEGRVMLWSAGATRIFGWREDEVVGRPLPTIPPDQQDAYRRLFERQFTGESIEGLEIARRRKDGSLVDVRLWTAPVRDTEGRILASVGLQEDITEHARGTAALREIQEWQRTILESVPVVLYRASASDPYGSHWISENVFRLTGFPAERFTAEPSFWASRVHPDDREAACGQFSTLSERDVSRVEYRWQCADGAYRWFLDQSYLAEAGPGGARAFLGTWLDITEQKQAEAAAERRAHQLDVVRSVSAEISQENDLATLLELILRRAMELTGTSGGGVYLWSEEDERLVPRVWRGVPDDAGRKPLRRGEGVCGVVAERRVGMAVNDYAASEIALPEFVAAAAAHAVCAEPLLYRDRLVGVIVVGHQAAGRRLTEQDQAILRTFADQAAIAIENARLHTRTVMELLERRTAETRLQARNRQLEGLQAIVLDLTTQMALDPLLASLVAQAHRLLAADRTAVRLWDPQEQVLIPVAWAGKPMVLGNAPMRLGQGAIGTAAQQRKPVVVDEYSRYAGAIPSVAAAGANKAMVACPLLHQGELLGTVSVGRDEGSPPFSPDEVEILGLLAGHAAIAISQARLYAAAKRRGDLLARLAEGTRNFTSRLDKSDVVKGILAAAIALFPTGAMRLHEWLEEQGELVLLGAEGTHEEFLPLYRSDNGGGGLSRCAMAIGAPIISEDMPSDPRVRNREWVLAEGIRSGLVVPLLLNGKSYGVLAIHCRERHHFSPDEIMVFQGLANHAAIAIENVRLFDRANAARQQLFHLSRQLVSAQEEERHRLSRELHDEAGQSLAALRIALSLVKDQLPAECKALYKEMSEAIHLTEATTDQLRLLAQDLRPPALDTLGLDAALEGFCRVFAGRTQLGIEYAGTPLAEVPDPIGIHLYRCLQEALTNVAKHAKARRVRVALGVEGESLTLRVEDDGAGFDARASADPAAGTGIGLTGMRERIELLRGRLDVHSRLGEGTRLVMTIPWRRRE
jgi:PAS domain S-box-containing protein